MKSERSSRLVLFCLIFAIAILHAVKLREQRFTSTEAGMEPFLVKIPGATSILLEDDASLHSFNKGSRP